MSINNSFKLIVLLLSLSFAFYACSDSSTSADDDPEEEISGFELSIEGAPIVTYMNGTYTFGDPNVVPEYLSGNAFMLSTTHNGGNLVRTSATEEEIGGRRYFTPSLQIRFMDSDGNILNLPEERVDGDINPEGMYRLNWEWTDPVANRSANNEQHGSDGSWGFHIRADYVGQTGLIFHLDRCDGDRQLVNVDGENHRQDQIRECSVAEERVFSASSAFTVIADEYELADENGAYPHNRFERRR